MGLSVLLHDYKIIEDRIGFAVTTIPYASFKIGRSTGLQSDWPNNRSQDLNQSPIPVSCKRARLIVSSNPSMIHPTLCWIPEIFDHHSHAISSMRSPTACNCHLKYVRVFSSDTTIRRSSQGSSSFTKVVVTCRGRMLCRTFLPYAGMAAYVTLDGEFRGISEVMLPLQDLAKSQSGFQYNLLP